MPLYRHLAATAMLALLACREAPPALETTVGPGTATASATDSGPAPDVAGGAPHPIAFDPPLGAAGVDPSRNTLAVTFDRPMDPQGWAWVVESTQTAPDIGESHWDAAVRVNTAHVRLEPGRDYVVWINSPAFAYFRDTAGVPAVPVRWEFSTAAGPAPAAGPVAPVRAHVPSAAGTDVPRVVTLSPPAGATVDAAAVGELRVVFDRPMGEGWSWVMENGASFPPVAGEAYQTPDALSAVLPVRLEPGKSYVVWLNGEHYSGFHARGGLPLPPVRWTFSTLPAAAASAAGQSR
jgi:RNA polymerase sigma-70 factor (ECF subfamily)